MPEDFSLTEKPLESHENTIIGSIPDKDEVYNALVSMGPTKAPGPDGYPAMFYQKCWAFVGDETTDYIRSIFETATVPHAIGHTFLALIPKIPDPCTEADYRPISLCNVIYKIVTRILTFRIRPFLDKLISENQNAFVPGRQICDNFVIANEMIHFMKNSKAKDGFFALKVDLAKAYDRVDWGFLSTVLKSFGIVDKSHELIMSCVTTPSFSVLVNGRAKGFFKAGRGLRQGCPLSPYLFILTSELLSRLFTMYERDGLYSGVKINRYAPSISHLMFADDLLLFGKGTDETVLVLKEILEKYSNWSGQSINFHKSAIHFSKSVNNLSRLLFPLRLGVKEMRKDDKYLGNFPLLPKHLKSSYDFILSSCRKKLAGWKKNSLSHAGRTVLLKAALANVPVYYLSTGIIPKGVVEKLSQLQRAFWWGHDAGKKKLHFIKWECFIKPKCLGGLGIRDLGVMNEALVCNLAWRFLTNPDALWVRLLNAKYLKNANYWNTDSKKSHSHCWKGIIGQREVLRKGAIWLIGNGQKVKIWEDPWVPGLHQFKVMERNDGSPNVRFVAELIDHDRRCWRADLLNQMFNRQTVEAISQIKLNHTNQEDGLIWMKSKNGKFSTKSAYQEIIQNRPSSSRSSGQNSSCWNRFWNQTQLIPKVHLFLWRLLNNGLGVAARVHGMMQHTDAGCAICGAHEETLDHAFLQCNHARASWLLSPLGMRTSMMQRDLISTVWYWIENEDRETITTAANLLWTIWKHRWQFIREGVKLQPSRTVQDAVKLSITDVNLDESPRSSLLNTGEAGTGANSIQENSNNSLMQINADGGLRNNLGAAAAVLTNPEGKFLSAEAVVEDSNCVAYMEAVAIRLGLMLAQARGLKTIRLVSDALGLVDAINSGSQNFPWQARMIVGDILRLQKEFDICIIRFVRRSQNHIADVLVKEALESRSNHSWNVCPTSILPFVNQ